MPKGTPIRRVTQLRVCGAPYDPTGQKETVLSEVFNSFYKRHNDRLHQANEKLEAELEVLRHEIQVLRAEVEEQIEYGQLQENRLIAVVDGVEMFCHLADRSASSYLREQITLAGRRHNVDLRQTVPDPEETDDEEEETFIVETTMFALEE